MPGSPYAVLKHWLVEGPTLEAKGDRKTSNEILFPHDAIDISVYLKKSPVHAILSSSGAKATSFEKKLCVEISFACLASAMLRRWRFY